MLNTDLTNLYLPKCLFPPHASEEPHSIWAHGDHIDPVGETEEEHAAYDPLPNPLLAIVHVEGRLANHDVAKQHNCHWHQSVEYGQSAYDGTLDCTDGGNIDWKPTKFKVENQVDRYNDVTHTVTNHNVRGELIFFVCQNPNRPAVYDNCQDTYDALHQPVDGVNWLVDSSGLVQKETSVLQKQSLTTVVQKQSLTVVL